uniref:hypothetical protein n=1 Tax=Chamaesiphon sp. OTE_8_metabat_110 TaxID=2964696 RepID=UPI00286B0B93
IEIVRERSNYFVKQVHRVPQVQRFDNVVADAPQTKLRPIGIQGSLDFCHADLYLNYCKPNFSLDRHFVSY